METISIRVAHGNDRHFMDNIIEKYLYEMSAFTNMRMDCVGRYASPHIDAYFGMDRKYKRKIYLIEIGHETAGFVMVSNKLPYEKLDELGMPEGYERPDWCMVALTVFPQMRNCGIGRDAVELVVANHPGTWALKFDERNAPAKALWTSFAEDHGGEIHEIGEHARLLTFTV